MSKERTNKNQLEPLPPDLGLFDSMRDIGYSVENAIADLIDNSIAANSTEINIEIVFNGIDSYIRIENNGRGMTQAQLNEALTFGKKPDQKRVDSDLGRFGLGLKSASLSQGKRLSIFSHQNTEHSCGVWDTDLVKENGWFIRKVPFASTKEIIKPRLKVKKGTVLVIEDLDKLLNETADDSDLFYEKINAVCDHLSLVFHKFIQGKDVKKIKITYQGAILDPIDPFDFSKIMDKGRILLYNDQVNVQSFILPHETKMSKSELKKANLEKGMTQNQGFYIYRANRLIVSGGWLNMIKFRSIEPRKLCRIMIDIPNNLDEVWGIDVKKSKASIPNKVYSEVFNLVEKSITDSESKYIYRSGAKRPRNKENKWIWIIKNSGKGKVYEINRDHPLVEALRETLKNSKIKENEKMIDDLIDHIENNLPISEIIADVAMESADLSDNFQEKIAKTKKIAANYKRMMMSQGISETTINDILKETDLWID